MKTLVVYESATGFTKQYAEWIAEEVSCDAISLKEASKEEIAQYDTVIFGGWVMGGGISGLEKMLQMPVKRLVLFAVGYTPAELVDTAAMMEENHIEETPFFYFTGGMRWEKLNFAVRGMLKVMRKGLVKKADKTPVEQFLTDNLCVSSELANRENIAPLVEAVRMLSTE